MKADLDKKTILMVFEKLNTRLKKKGVIGEIYLVGGAVMCLAFQSRPSTKDIDAFFVPKEIVREESKKALVELNLDENSLNDAVKGFMSQSGKFEPYLDLPNLKIFTAHPEYLLAMKCLSMRIGKEFHDEHDVRFLLRYLNLENYNNAVDILKKYYPLESYPQKTLYILEEILAS